MKKIICITLLVFMVMSHVSAQGDVQKNEVMMKMLSLKNALIGKDSVSLSGLLAEDVTYGHSTGMVQTKAQLIRSVVSGEQDYRSMEPSDMNVRIYDNTGVVTLKLKAHVVIAGKPTDLNMTATLTWVKINGEWKLVARQSARLPE